MSLTALFYDLFERIQRNGIMQFVTGHRRAPQHHDMAAATQLMADIFDQGADIRTFAATYR